LDALLAAKGIRCNPVAMSETERDLYRKTHETIQRVTSDMEKTFHFNAAIAQIMELANATDAFGLAPDSGEQQRAVYRHAVETSLLLLSPFAPHIAEELWEEIGNPPGITRADWPALDPEALKREEIEIVVQINGRLRGRMVVPAGASNADVERLALDADNVRRHLNGKQIRKVVVVPNKLVNIAVS